MASLTASASIQASQLFDILNLCSGLSDCLSLYRQARCLISLFLTFALASLTASALYSQTHFLISLFLTFALASLAASASIQTSPLFDILISYLCSDRSDLSDCLSLYNQTHLLISLFLTFALASLAASASAAMALCSCTGSRASFLKS
jgi:hypothetical protein